MYLIDENECHNGLVSLCASVCTQIAYNHCGCFTCPARPANFCATLTILRGENILRDKESGAPTELLLVRLWLIANCQLVSYVSRLQMRLVTDCFAGSIFLVIRGSHFLQACLSKHPVYFDSHHCWESNLWLAADCHWATVEVDVIHSHTSCFPTSNYIHLATCIQLV